MMNTCISDVLHIGVDVAKDEKKNIDQELAKLRKLDPTLAAEMDEYRRTYVSGLQAVP